MREQRIEVVDGRHARPGDGLLAAVHQWPVPARAERHGAGSPSPSMRTTSKCAASALDLAQEVRGREAVLAQPVRQRVGRRGEHHASLGQPLQQRRHQHGVAGVVQLELVDADQPMLRQLSPPRPRNRAPRPGWSARRRCRRPSAPAPRATATPAGASCPPRSRRRGRSRPVPLVAPARAATSVRWLTGRPRSGPRRPAARRPPPPASAAPGRAGSCRTRPRRRAAAGPASPTKLAVSTSGNRSTRRTGDTVSQGTGQRRPPAASATIRACSRLLPGPRRRIALRRRRRAGRALRLPRQGAVRANMVASVDGAITLDGRSQADLRMTPTGSSSVCSGPWPTSSSSAPALHAPRGTVPGVRGRSSPPCANAPGSLRHRRSPWSPRAGSSTRPRTVFGGVSRDHRDHLRRSPG